MNKFFKTLSFIAVMMLFATACSTPVAQAAPAAAGYQAVLGKPVSDNSVADFIASNKCSSVSQFQLCQGVGMALWIDPAQKINTVYLYAQGENGFAAYKGVMPFGLAFKDTMADVEQKFGQPKIGRAHV